jgi:hypothetical protein
MLVIYSSLPFPSLLSSLFSSLLSLPSPSSLFSLSPPSSLFPLSSLSLSPLLSLPSRTYREGERERERGTYLRRGDDGVDDGGARRRRSPGRNFGSLTAGV